VSFPLILGVFNSGPVVSYFFFHQVFHPLDLGLQLLDRISKLLGLSKNNWVCKKTIWVRKEAIEFILSLLGIVGPAKHRRCQYLAHLSIYLLLQ
jgi:hypothetical protein